MFFIINVCNNEVNKIRSKALNDNLEAYAWSMKSHFQKFVKINDNTIESIRIDKICFVIDEIENDALWDKDVTFQPVKIANS